MAGRGSVESYRDGVVRVAVSDATWLRQMLSMRSQLAADLQRIAALPVRAIEFEVSR
jgi:hypothetical protein